MGDITDIILTKTTNDVLRYLIRLEGCFSRPFCGDNSQAECAACQLRSKRCATCNQLENALKAL